MRETQRKGDIATTKAIAYFTEKGYDVSVPITESASYDLIVEKDCVCYRVQCKYSNNKSVDLRRIHSNSKGYVVKKNKINDYDWLFVFYKNKLYLIKECKAQSTISMKDEFLL